MTTQHNEESKLFFLVKSDVQNNISHFTQQIGTSLRHHMISSLLKDKTKEAMNFYLNEQPAYPKICKRFKSKHINTINTALIELEKKEISFTTYKDLEKNKTTLIIVGPCKRQDLPKNLEKLQLLQDCLISPELKNIQTQNKDVIEILYRTDITIPTGKLIPQIGHAIQKQICEQPVSNLYKNFQYILKPVSLKELIACENYITDAGRTIFNEPTPTTGFRKIC